VINNFAVESKRSMRCSLIFLASMILAAHGLNGGETINNGPAIRVNNQVVSIRDVEMVFADSYALIQDKLRSGELAERQWNDAIRYAWEEALNTAAQDRLLDQRADQRKKEIMRYYIEGGGPSMGAQKAIEYFEREMKVYVQKLRRELVTAAGGEEELRSALKRRGQTLNDWESGLQRELFRRDVMSLELGAIARSPAAVRQFYERNPEFFRQPEAWRLRRIRIAKSKFSSADKALEAAALVKRKIDNGGDFGEIASRISDDPEFASTGGLLTRNEKTDLPAGAFPFEEKIAADLQDGSVSEPHEGGNWFVLVQRVGHRKAVVQNFDEAAERAEALMYAEKLRERKKAVFEKLRKESYVEFVQKDPPPQYLKNDSPFADPNRR